MTRWITEAEIAAALPYDLLVEALREGFGREATMPPRIRYDVACAPGASLFTMPCWQAGLGMTVKLMTAFPGNAALGRRTSSEILVLFDDRTGAVRAVIESHPLTNRRTAAASALASTFLSRSDSRCLAVLGTGPLARDMAEAHCAVRPIEDVRIWGRSDEKATQVASDLRERGLPARADRDLDRVLGEADIITAATRATDPIVRGAAVRPGTHVDLVGGYKPDMRESDDALAIRARIYVDQLQTALDDPGDIVQPIASGLIGREAVLGDLRSLVTGEVAGRTDTEAVTLFKSVGCGLEDLSAARLLMGRLDDSSSRR